MGSSSKISLSSGDFNELLRKRAKGFEGVHGENDIGEEMRKKEDC